MFVEPRHELHIKDKVHNVYFQSSLFKHMRAACFHFPRSLGHYINSKSTKSKTVVRFCIQNLFYIPHTILLKSQSVQSAGAIDQLALSHSLMPLNATRRHLIQLINCSNILEQTILTERFFVQILSFGGIMHLFFLTNSF